MTSVTQPAYDAAWFERYAAYLEYPTVKRTHRFMFDAFVTQMVRAGYSKPRTVDLGCGTCEFGRYVQTEGTPGHYEYLGIDKSPYAGTADLNVDVGDYRSDDFKSIFGHFNSFVSLFSTELHLPADERLKFYEELFSYRDMKLGLVTGLYYKHNPTAPMIHEIGGFDIYQSGTPTAYSDVFDEVRVECPVPPGFFEDHFVEVWKLMRRTY